MGDHATPSVPAGFWQRDVVHCPQPVSTLMTTAVLPLVGEASRWWFTGVGALPERLEWREIGGWTYLRRVDAADPGLALARAAARGDEVVAQDLVGVGLVRWHETWRPDLERRVRALRAVDRSRLTDAGLAEHLAATLALQARALETHFRVHALLTVALADLVRTTREVLGGDADVALGLLGGTAPVLHDLTRSLDGLAEVAARSRGVRALLDRAVHEDVAPSLLSAGRPDDPGVAAFLDLLGDHLERFGHRTPGYELIHPTAAEDPTLALRAVHARRHRGRDDVARAAPEGTASVPGLESVLARARAAYPLREESGPTTWTEPLALVRYAALEIGRRARARGVLDREDDVFWLGVDDVRALTAGAAPDRHLPAARRHDAARAGATTPPPTVGRNPGPPPTDELPAPARWINEGLLWLVGRMLEPARLATRAAPDRDITGVAASRGRAAGPVRVVRHHDDLARLRPGDVLVCPTLLAAWTAVLPTVAAVVTDSGGTLSHSAIMAREFGVPAVVATGDASRILTDDQVVEVDGSAGSVRLRESTAGRG